MDPISAMNDDWDAPDCLLHFILFASVQGLLAMLAVQHGADSVTACEAFEPVAQAAKLIIEDNGMEDKIKLVMKRSTALQIPEDLEERCNILVSEVFDTELIGEGALGVFIHAHENLLSQDVITVPYAATVYIQVVESHFLLQHNHLGDNIGLNVPTEWRDCPGPSSVHDLQLSQLYPRQDFRRLSEVQPLYEFCFSKRNGLTFHVRKIVQIFHIVIYHLMIHVFLITWYGTDTVQVQASQL